MEAFFSSAVTRNETPVSCAFHFLLIFVIVRRALED